MYYGWTLQALPYSTIGYTVTGFAATALSSFTMTRSTRSLSQCRFTVVHNVLNWIGDTILILMFSIFLLAKCLTKCPREKIQLEKKLRHVWARKYKVFDEIFKRENLWAEREDWCILLSPVSPWWQPLDSAARWATLLSSCTVCGFYMNLKRVGLKAKTTC